MPNTLELIGNYYWYLGRWDWEDENGVRYTNGYDDDPRSHQTVNQAE